MNNGWKITAIIFITLFTIETGLIVLGYNISVQEEENMNNCFYNICSNYVEADYLNGVCTCYTWNDYTGEYDIAKESYID